MDKPSLLARAPLFAGLPPPALRALASRCIERRVPKGALLFTAGQASMGLFIVVEGCLHAFRENLEGREQVIHVDRAVSTLAEVPAFDGLPYPSNVVAEEDSVVLFLPRRDLEPLCREHPEIALAAARVLAGKLRRTVALVEALSLRGVDQRLATWLLVEAATRGRRTPRGLSVVLPSNTEIGARLGTVREVVSRAFSRMKKQGLVEAGRGRRVVILDETGLKRFSGEA
jgi:CRP/FNR family transcriptional regulator